jgi:hypothetical protein
MFAGGRALYTSSAVLEGCAVAAACCSGPLAASGAGFKACCVILANSPCCVSVLDCGLDSDLELDGPGLL